jgi:hypothetical protein
MQDGKRLDLDLRRPGTRRILDALRQIEKEAPGLINEVTLGATESTADTYLSDETSQFSRVDSC